MKKRKPEVKRISPDGRIQYSPLSALRSAGQQGDDCGLTNMTIAHGTATYHQEGESWWVEDSAMPGWTGVGNSQQECRDLLIEARVLATAPHDDCAALRTKFASLEAAVRKYAEFHGPSTCIDCEGMDSEGQAECGCEGAAIDRALNAALSGEPTALREMLVEAAESGYYLGATGVERGADGSVTVEASKARVAARSASDRILKGGGR